MDKFQKTLDTNHGVSLLKFKYNGTEFDVRSTDHSISRFIENGIDVDAAVGSIVALGKERLYRFAKENSDVAIIDREHGIVTIITFESNQIRIRTIIPNSNAFIKSGTKIYNLNQKSFGRR
jgi:hypothetical protein